MSIYHYPAVYPSGTRPVSYHAPGGDACANLVQLATLGAVVGASTAAAKAIGQIQQGEIDTQQALAHTARAALTAATTTAIAGAAANAVGHHGLARLGVLFLAGTALMYGIEKRLHTEQKNDV